MFGRRKKLTNLVPPVEAMKAKPVRAVEATVERDSDRGGKVTVPLRPDAFGFVGRLLRLPPGASKTFELDAVGLFVWDRVDGQTSVREIARKLAAEYQLDVRVAEVSTAQFLKTLLRRGLIGMPMPKLAKPR